MLTRNSKSCLFWFSTLDQSSNAQGQVVTQDGESIELYEVPDAPQNDHSASGPPGLHRTRDVITEKIPSKIDLDEVEEDSNLFRRIHYVIQQLRYFQLHVICQEQSLMICLSAKLFPLWLRVRFAMPWKVVSPNPLCRNRLYRSRLSRNPSCRPGHELPRRPLTLHLTSQDTTRIPTNLDEMSAIDMVRGTSSTRAGSHLIEDDPSMSKRWTTLHTAVFQSIQRQDPIMVIHSTSNDATIVVNFLFIMIYTIV